MICMVCADILCQSMHAVLVCHIHRYYSGASCCFAARALRHGMQHVTQCSFPLLHISRPHHDVHLAVTEQRGDNGQANSAIAASDQHILVLCRVGGHSHGCGGEREVQWIELNGVRSSMEPALLQACKQHSFDRSAELPPGAGTGQVTSLRHRCPRHAPRSPHLLVKQFSLIKPSLYTNESTTEPRVCGDAWLELL